MSFRERADPEITPVLDLLPVVDRAGDIPAARAKAAEDRKAFIEAMADVPGVSTRDVVVPGLDGDPEVMVRLYEPEGGHHGGALSYIHGGGMVLMQVADTDFHCKRIAADVGCLVASVEYRLAPERPYPAALHDCYAALRWLGQHRNATPSSLEITEPRVWNRTSNLRAWEAYLGKLPRGPRPGPAPSQLSGVSAARAGRGGRRGCRRRRGTRWCSRVAG